jgi:hypothetical protein
LQIADFGLQIADCRLQIADCGLKDFQSAICNPKSAIRIAEVGIEPTDEITRLSTWPLFRFAYSAKKVADSGVAPDHWAYETLSDTGPSAK